jgi:hypothetical protein
MKDELEDLSLKHLNRDVYDQIKHIVSFRRESAPITSKEFRKRSKRRRKLQAQYFRQRQGEALLFDLSKDAQTEQNATTSTIFWESA